MRPIVLKTAKGHKSQYDELGISHSHGPFAVRRSWGIFGSFCELSKGKIPGDTARMRQAVSVSHISSFCNDYSLTIPYSPLSR